MNENLYKVSWVITSHEGYIQTKRTQEEISMRCIDKIERFAIKIIK